MKDIRKLTYSDFYYIPIEEFYTYCSIILKQLNYIFFRRIIETSSKRTEVWQLGNAKDNKALVYLEMLAPGEELGWDKAAAILKLMNEEEITILYLFTNGALDNDAKEIIEDDSRFIYTPRVIIERLLNLENQDGDKNTETEKSKRRLRKKNKFPSGKVLLSDYFKSNKPAYKNIDISIDEMVDIVNQYLKKSEEVLSYIDHIKNIDYLSKKEKASLIDQQYSFLPAIPKIISLSFNKNLNNIKTSLLSLVKNIIMYIGAIANYEPIEDINNFRENILKENDLLSSTGDIVYKLMEENIGKSSSHFEKMLIYGFIIAFIFIIIIFIIT